MAEPDDEVQRTLRDLPFRVKRRIAAAIHEQAEALAAELRDEAPEGETGNTKESVRVRRGRNMLEVIVSAGGPLTTKPVRKGTHTEYDYALAAEFGTQHQPASPWFFPTCRAREAEINAAIEDEVEQILKDA